MKTGKTLSYRYVICSAVFIGYILVFFHRLCPAVIALEMQQTFGISGTLLGVLASAYFYPYAIMQIPTGLLADSWGPRKTITVFFLLAAFGSLLMGLSPDLSTAILGRILAGLGVSTLFVCNFKLLAEWFDPREFTIMGGIFVALGGVGALFSSVPLAWTSNLIGWRMTLVAVAGLTLIMAVLIYALVRDSPSEIGLPPIGLLRTAETLEAVGLGRGIITVLATPCFWPVSVWGFCTAGVSFALGGLWGGPYLVHTYGLSKTAASQVLSMFAAALIVGSPLSGWIANQVGRKPVLVLSSLVLTSVCLFFYVLPSGLPLWLLYLLFFLVFLSSAASAQVSTAACKELFPVAMAGTTIGTLNIFPFLGGAFFQILTGSLLAAGGQVGGVYSLAGYRSMFLLYLAASFISLAVSFFVKETLVREKAVPRR